MAERTTFHGVEAVRWTSRDGASATATLQGAHLVSWRTATGEEMLFVSERSAYEAGRPIRGGIPVCFPQFAERGPLVKHGFARTLPWRFLGAEETGRGARALFALESSPATLQLWPHPFLLELAATIHGTRLEVELGVTNRGEQAMAFAAALHTYFRVSDASAARLAGLDGVRVPIDRVYHAAPGATRLDDSERRIGIEQRAFPDTVVWNPGPEGVRAMPDMAPDGWLGMFCVEAAAVEPISLAPGGRWVGAQAIELTSP